MSLDQTEMIQALSQLVQQRMLLARAEEGNIALDEERQGQLDTRIDQLYLESYLREAAEAQLEISDVEIERYYEEHQEFYRDQTLDVARQQIRQALIGQRMESANAPEAQRDLVAAVADSMAETINVVRYEEQFPAVLSALRASYEELGQTAPTTTRAARVEQAVQQPPPGAAPGSSNVSSTP
jgi:hypothetical protein